MSVAFDASDRALLAKLNAGSWERTFTPQDDVDWTWTTTDDEYRALYDAWSLLKGSRHDAKLTDAQRVAFARYQQMNLMTFTGAFERFGMSTFQDLWRDDDDPAYQEYVAHLIKEETYHYLLFQRGVERLRGDAKPLPTRHVHLYLTIAWFLLRMIPFRRLRHGAVFSFLRFAEEITLIANSVARDVLPRPESLVPRIWHVHALDEARHVAFDDLMMKKASSRVAKLLALPLCIGASLLLNANEIWAARTLGVRVGYHEVPKLIRTTTARFKRRVFGILFQEKKVPFTTERLTSIETYMYGLKRRAHLHHCLVHGTFPVDLEKLTEVRKEYSKRVRPVTLLPFFIKAVALSVKATPGVNRILFKRFPFGKRIVRFDVVDVNVPITREIDGEMTTFIGTIRGADALTVGQIQDALEEMQRGPPENSPYIRKVQKLKSAPPIVASLFHWLMTRSPAFYLKNAGTCSVTTLDGMRGDHFFSIGPTTSLFCIGNIGDEPVARDGQVVVRRMLKAALALDNYVVTGLDGVMLAKTFQELIETCSFVDAAPGPPQAASAAA